MNATPRRSSPPLRSLEQRRGDPGRRRLSNSPFWALSVAILRGFVRDKASVFFAIIFPLMFLVLFGSLLANQNQSKVELGHGFFGEDRLRLSRLQVERRSAKQLPDIHDSASGQVESGCEVRVDCRDSVLCQIGPGHTRPCISEIVCSRFDTDQSEPDTLRMCNRVAENCIRDASRWIVAGDVRARIHDIEIHDRTKPQARNDGSTEIGEGVTEQDVVIVRGIFERELLLHHSQTRHMPPRAIGIRCLGLKQGNSMHCPASGRDGTGAFAVQIPMPRGRVRCRNGREGARSICNTSAPEKRRATIG